MPSAYSSALRSRHALAVWADEQGPELHVVDHLHRAVRQRRKQVLMLAKRQGRVIYVVLAVHEEAEAGTATRLPA
jgi:hypothetical protein